MAYLFRLKYSLLFLTFLLMLNLAWWNLFKWPYLIFYVTFLLAALFVIITRKNIVPSIDELLLLAYPVYRFLNGFFIGAENSSMLLNLSFIFFCLSFLYFGREKFELRAVIKTLVLIIFLQSFIGFIEFLMGSTFYITWRAERITNLLGFSWVSIGSTAMDPNYLALNILPIIPLCVYLIKTSKRTLHKSVPFLLIGFFLLILILTNSRAAFFTLVIMGAMFIFERKHAIKVISFIGIFVAIVIFINARDFLENLSSLRNVDASAWIRISIWQSLFNSFLDNPVFGIGQGKYNELSIEYLRLLGVKTDMEWDPMNMYLGNLAEYGSVGFILLMSLLLNNIRLLNKQIKSVSFDQSSFARYFLISILGWMIMSFSLDGTSTYLFWILATLPIINKVKKQRVISRFQPEFKKPVNYIHVNA